MSMFEYAMNEFKAAGWVDENGKYIDEMQEQICKDVLVLLDVMGSQGHSGSSLPYVMNLLTRLVSFKPLTELTGEPEEWNDISYLGGGLKWQNKRCHEVFKDEDGTSYMVGAIVFKDKNGDCYTGSGSSKDITFPFSVPDKPEYRDAPEEDE